MQMILQLELDRRLVRNEIEMSSTYIELKKEKFLGPILDKRLTWKYYINKTI